MTSQAIVSRILDVLPAHSFEMLTFFSLFQVRLSEKVETACVTCREAPVMLLNEAFIESHCKTDEHLLMLVMHELYHVILGHTRLFPHSTPKLNVIFDAVINAILCSLFPGEEYTSFFTSYYPADEMPFALLRPPGEGTPPEAEEALRLLYGENGCATYYDVAQALAAMPDEIFILLGPPAGGIGAPAAGDGSGAGAGGGDDESPGGGGETGDKDGPPVLLGSHEADGSGAPSPELKELLDKIIAKWPCPNRPLRGRDMGGEEREREFGDGGAGDAALARALRRLMRKATLPGPAEMRRRAVHEVATESSTFLPTWTDRTHEAREMALGEALLWRVQTPVRRPVCRDRRKAFVYLDVSGSLEDKVATLAGAIEPFHRKGLCAVHVFSTTVAETTVKDLSASRFRTTGGTDINCVFEHVLSLPARKRPKSIVVVTDGYTGSPAPALAERFRAAGMKMFVGLVEDDGHDASRALAGIAESFDRLPTGH